MGPPVSRIRSVMRAPFPCCHQFPSNGILWRAGLNEEMSQRAASRPEKDTHTFTLWNSDVSDEEKGPTLQSNLRKVTGKKSFHRASFDVTVQFALELLH